MKNIAITSLLIILLASCSEDETVQSKEGTTSVPVKVETLKRTEWSRPVMASGRFSAQDENMLAFKIGGVIDRIYVDEGDRITKGQLLARLNPTEIASATTQAKVGLEKAERDFNRAQRLYEDSVATLEQLQNAETALKIAQEQFTTAEFNKSYSEIRALSDGYVLLKLGNDGEVVSGGTPVLRTAVSAGEWKLDVGVSGRDLAKISIGDTATLTLDALPEAQIRSVVIRKSKSASPMSGSFALELSVESKYAEELASGMFGKAKIYPSKKKEGWSLPYGALLDANGGKGYVFVLENDTTAKRLEVETGEISSEKVLVTGGLENYETLIVSGSPYLSDGSRITIIK